MDIFPQDLSAARQARLAQAPPLPPQRRSGWWLALLVFLLAQALGWLQGDFVTQLVVVPSVLAFLGARALWSRRRAHTAKDAPLTPAHVQRLQVGCGDPLERQYLELLRMTLQMPRPLEEPARSEVRDAVRALGSALDHLPPPSRVLNDSAYDLTVSAAGLAVDADREPDPVIAASLRRRADSRRQQAETVALLATQARRGAALRAELSDEMASLQTSLTALSAPGVWSAQEMADVSAGINWIALKARTLMAAQAELDEALSVPGVLPPLHEGPHGTRQRLPHHATDDGDA